MIPPKQNRGVTTDALAMTLVHSAIVQILEQDKDTQALFGAPVETSILPDYDAIIEKPRDLGTIAGWIDDSLDGRGPYSTYGEALADVQLVWRNCLRYNDRPEDAEIVSLCNKSRKLFKEALKEICARSAVRLVDTPVQAVLDEPMRFSVDGPGNELPVEDIVDFVIISATDEEPVDLLTLGQMRSLNETALISGCLVESSSHSPGGKQTVENVPIIDWAIERSIASIDVWVITKNTWYRLRNPAIDYEDIYVHVLDAIDLIEAAIDVIEMRHDVELKQILSDIVKEKRLKGKVAAQVKKFALLHLEALYGQRKETYSMWRESQGLEEDPDYEAISDDDIPDDFDLDEEEFDIEDDDPENFERARKKAWRRQKYKTQKRLKQEIIDKKRLEAEREGHERRGSPPEMSTSFRLPPNKVHEVLFLWSFLQEFGDVLRLPPFSFRTLEASLCPGPSVSVTIQDHHQTMLEHQHACGESKGPQKKEDAQPDLAMQDPTSKTIVRDETPHACVHSSDMDTRVQEGGRQDSGSGLAKIDTNPGIETRDVLSDRKKNSSSKQLDDGKNVQEGSSEPKEITSTVEVQTEINCSLAKIDRIQENVPASSDQRNDHDQVSDPTNTFPDDSSTAPAFPGQVKRGRGRPRKDGSAPRPRQLVGLPKVAPQNVVLDPTVRTRRQRGVTVTSRKLDEYALDIDEVLKDEEYRLPKQRKKIIKPKAHVAPIQPYQAENGPNSISEAIKNAQKLQQEYDENLKKKYGITSEVLKSGSPVDKYYAPSGVLVRDIVLALLGVIDETLPPIREEMKRPTSASTILPSRNQKSLWPEAAANNVWSWRSIWKEAKDAALHLAYGEFVDLSIEERVEVLLGLLYEAIESKYISGEISKRADKCLQQQATWAAIDCSKAHGDDLKKDIISQIDQLTLEDDGHYNGSKALKDWMTWLDVLGFGPKTCIGQDFGGRRYWALGNESGAFRIFCQELTICENGRESDSWGWYEGSRLDELVEWLQLADIRSERPLIAALSTAPSPISSCQKTFSSTIRSWKISELENQRADGYRNISQPLLRGEWNHCNGKPIPLGIEQRASQAIESLLGSITFWFEKNSLSKKIFGISDILANAQPKACARALLESDKLLLDAGKVTDEWIDIWSSKWRTSVVSVVDSRDIALHIAALQSHVILQSDVIPRGTFKKILEDLNCVLTIPLPSDSIAVMKTGILKHIDKALDLLGLSEKKDLEIPADTKSQEIGISSINDSEIEPSILPVKSSSLECIKSKWMYIRGKIQNMKYIEQYIVRGIIYRRHLVDSEHINTEGFTKEESALLMRPVAWMYLKPVEYALECQTSTECITVPIVLDPGLEDFLVPLDKFKLLTSLEWCDNDRFKLFVPPTPSQRRSKSVGYWKKGTVVQNLIQENAIMDPWKSVIVEFDNAPVGETTNVSPWNLEIDPDEEKAAVEEARKLEQTIARAQRARSSSRSTDLDEAAMQEAEWAQEDRQLEQALKQAQRSEYLLKIHSLSTPSIPGEVQNEAFYSAEERGNYYNYLSDIGSELYTKYATLASKSRSKVDARSVTNAYPTGPLVPGQQIDPKILEALRALTRNEFMTLLQNFYVGLKGKFKVPIFAHKELDLFVVWWSVMDRFGYETVTNEKRWKDICRSLNLDLSGQTSASFNMRLNYERCLLDFENYLACGQYELDLAANKAPVHTHLMNPATTRFLIPGAYEDNAIHVESPLTASFPSENDRAQSLLAPLGSAGTAQHMSAAASMGGPDIKTESVRNPLMSAETNSQNKSNVTKIKLKHPGIITANTSQENLGPRLKSSGSDVIGMFVDLFWPTEGGWWRAEIINFDPDTKHHQILYNRGLPDESFEWVDMAGLSSKELRLTNLSQI